MFHRSLEYVPPEFLGYCFKKWAEQVEGLVQKQMEFYYSTSTYINDKRIGLWLKSALGRSFNTAG